jgi:DNA-binding PadR family transcriptional regulator
MTDDARKILAYLRDKGDPRKNFFISPTWTLSGSIERDLKLSHSIVDYELRSLVGLGYVRADSKTFWSMVEITPNGREFLEQEETKMNQPPPDVLPSEWTIAKTLMANPEMKTIRNFGLFPSSLSLGQIEQVFLDWEREGWVRCHFESASGSKRLDTVFLLCDIATIEERVRSKGSHHPQGNQNVVNVNAPITGNFAVGNSTASGNVIQIINSNEALQAAVEKLIAELKTQKTLEALGAASNVEAACSRTNPYDAAKDIAEAVTKSPWLLERLKNIGCAIGRTVVGVLPEAIKFYLISKGIQLSQ